MILLCLFLFGLGLTVYSYANHDRHRGVYSINQYSEGICAGIALMVLSVLFFVIVG